MWLGTIQTGHPTRYWCLSQISECCKISCRHSRAQNASYRTTSYNNERSCARLRTTYHLPQPSNRNSSHNIDRTHSLHKYLLYGMLIIDTYTTSSWQKAKATDWGIAIPRSTKLPPVHRSLANVLNALPTEISVEKMVVVLAALAIATHKMCSIVLIITGSWWPKKAWKILYSKSHDALTIWYSTGQSPNISIV